MMLSDLCDDNKKSDFDYGVDEDDCDDRCLTFAARLLQKIFSQ